MTDRESLTAYLYDRNGVYIGTDIAYPDPLEVENYLVPGNGTLIAPPDAEEGKAIVWNGTAWSQVVDNRGTFLFNTATKERVIMGTPGEFPSGYTPLDPSAVTDPEWNGTAWISTTPPPTQDELWSLARARRNLALQSCDWTMLSDSPLSSDQKTAWVNYRAALRNITNAFSDPSAIVWPDEPA